MGEVLPFGARKGASVSNTKTEVTDQDPQHGLQLAADIEYCLDPANRALVQEACNCGDKITDYVFDMAGFVKKDESIDLRQGALRDTSLEDLSKALRDSNQLQWSKQPHYFGAVIVEMVERFGAIGFFRPDIPLPSFRE